MGGPGSSISATTAAGCGCCNMGTACYYLFGDNYGLDSAESPFADDTTAQAFIDAHGSCCWGLIDAPGMTSFSLTGTGSDTEIDLDSSIINIAGSPFGTIYEGFCAKAGDTIRIDYTLGTGLMAGLSITINLYKFEGGFVSGPYSDAGSTSLSGYLTITVPDDGNYVLKIDVLMVPFVPADHTLNTTLKFTGDPTVSFGPIRAVISGGTFYDCAPP